MCAWRCGTSIGVRRDITGFSLELTNFVFLCARAGKLLLEEL
jgi:hypothetical protein